MAKRSREEATRTTRNATKRCRRRAVEEKEEANVVVGGQFGGSLPEWRQKLWMWEMGYEELLWGWFPFVEGDFCSKERGLLWEEDDLGFEFDDDLWQIKHINQIPN